MTAPSLPITCLCAAAVFPGSAASQGARVFGTVAATVGGGNELPPNGSAVRKRH